MVKAGKKHRGAKLVFRAFLVGILLGLGIRWLQNYAAEQLRDFLASEIEKSTSCGFDSARIRVSLFSLSATARDAAISCNGTKRLIFKKLKASFGLSQLKQHIVRLEQLELIDGFSDGVGPESPTFKFIDYLAAPIDPARDYPGRWKLKLYKLLVQNSRFIDKSSSFELNGNGAGLSMWRDDSNNFEMRPEVAELSLKAGSKDSPEFRLGRVSGDMYITDDFIDFRSMLLKLRDANVTMSGKNFLTPARLDGHLQFSLDGQSLDLPKWLKLQVTGQSEISQTLDDPQFSGSFSAPFPLRITTDNESDLLNFSRFAGSFRISSQDGAVLDSLEAQNHTSRLILNSPLRYKSGQLSGSARFTASELSYPGVNLKNLVLDLQPSFADGLPGLSATGTFDSLSAGSYSLGGSRLKLLANPGRTQIEIQNPQKEGRLSLTAELDTSSTATQAEIALQLENFNPIEPSVEHNSTSAVRLNGNGRFSGPLELTALSGQALVNVSVAGSALGKANLTLGDGLLQADFVDTSLAAAGQISAKLRLNLSGGIRNSLNFSMKEVPLARLIPSTSCGLVDFVADYEFDLAAPLKGDGNLDVARLEAGCAPYVMSLSKPFKTPVKGGSLIFHELSFVEHNSVFELHGAISPEKGFDLRLSGGINLNTLLPLVPSLDDLSGEMRIAAGLKGPLNAPSLEGKASLKHARFSMESGNLAAHEISGELLLSGRKVLLDGVTGTVNNGSFSLNGEIAPFEPEQSDVRLSISGVSLDPSQNLTMLLSGDLSFKPTSDSAIVAGSINIDSGEFNQNLDLGTVVNSLFDRILSPSQQHTITTQLPPFTLDVNIHASHGLFVFTNWVGAELKADLKLAGTLASPQTEGRLETLSGWFGFRNRRFDINSGALIFKPEQSEPQLELSSETFVRSQYGDNVLVVLDAAGSLTSPRITLASDSGLSQKDILNLLTSSGAMPGTSRFERAGRGVELGEIPLLRDESLLNINKALYHLTSIDSVVLEPAYNTQRGVIEPTIVATKNINDRFSLIGENFFGSNATETSLRGLYRLSPALGLSGIIDTLSTRKNTAFGVDLTFTILAAQRQTLNIEIDGNSTFEKSEILQALRISESSLLPVTGVGDLKQRLSEFYEAHGYFGNSMNIECVSSDDYCHHLLIEVSEGTPSHVTGLIVEGDRVDEWLLTGLRRAILREPAAERNLLHECQDELIRRLRNDGYISARVDATYRPESPSSNNRNLVLKVNTGSPVSFTFTGNTLFTPEDFLKTINIFERRQPFGNNTINILRQNIERKYREAGYLFVSIRHSEQPADSTGRTNYLVEIDENGRVPVKNLDFEGNELLGTDTLKALVKESSPDLYTEIFAPRFAIAEQLDLNVKILRDAYNDQGYDDAQIEYRLTPDDQDSGISVTYRIVEGSRNIAADVIVKGIPSNVELPPYPRLWSSTATQSYTEKLSENLSSAGYTEAKVQARVEPADKVLHINVEPGAPLKVGNIRIEGNASIEESVIRRNLALKERENWDLEKINETRRNLLRLGLFQRVDIGAETDDSDASLRTMIVRVSERPLQTLELGGGLNSEYGLHLFGEATDRQLLSDGRSLVARLDTYYDRADESISQGIASLKYIDPHVTSAGYSLVEDLRFQRMQQPTQEFDLDRIALASYLYRSWEGGISTSFGHTVLQENLSSVAPDAVLSDLDTGVTNLSFLSGTFTYDQRDNPLNPRRGFTASLEGQLAWEGLGSDADYYSSGARFAWLYPLPTISSKLTLANNTRAAFAWSFASTTDIPISQRYYLGGRSTVRGFGENSLGPRGSEDSVIGGDTLLADNFELRYLLTEATSAHVFLDMGNVYLRDRNVALSDLRFSTGIGVQYLSPIGPIGFDIGHPLDREAGEKPWRLHFSIGTIF